MRREHGWRVPLDGVELEERVRVDDRGDVESPEKLPDQCPPLVRAAEPRPDRDSARALGGAGDLLYRVGVTPADLHRLENHRLDYR